MPSLKELITRKDIQIVPLSPEEARTAWMQDKVLSVYIRDASYRSNSGHYVVGNNVGWDAYRHGGDLGEVRRRDARMDIGFGKAVGWYALDFLEGKPLPPTEERPLANCEWFEQRPMTPAGEEYISQFKR